MEGLHCDYSWRLLESPASEPISLVEAKDHLNIETDVTDFDTKIAGFIASARAYIEGAYGLRIRKQKWELLFECFPRGDRFVIPAWPVQSVDYMRYRQVDDTVVPMAASTAYRTRLYHRPPQIVLPRFGVWPQAVLDSVDAIAVGLTLGWQVGDSPESLPLPSTVKQAMFFLLGHQFENGSEVTVDQRPPMKICTGVDAFLANDRIYW